jgi:hypothetical protein
MSPDLIALTMAGMFRSLNHFNHYHFNHYHFIPCPSMIIIIVVLLNQQPFHFIIPFIVIDSD